MCVFAHGRPGRSETSKNGSNVSYVCSKDRKCTPVDAQPSCFSFLACWRSAVVALSKDKTPKGGIALSDSAVSEPQENVFASTEPAQVWGGLPTACLYSIPQGTSNDCASLDESAAKASGLLVRDMYSHSQSLVDLSRKQNEKELNRTVSFQSETRSLVTIPLFPALLTADTLASHAPSRSLTWQDILSPSSPTDDMSALNAVANIAASAVKAREDRCEMQLLQCLGSSRNGVVYIGRWQGALVAVRFLVCSSASNLNLGAAGAMISKMVAHPNVLQTFDCKTELLQEQHFDDAADVLVDGNDDDDDDASDDSSLSLDSCDGEFVTAAQNCQPSRSRLGHGSSGLSHQHHIPLHQVLHQLHATPGQHLTQVMTEFCDQGTLRAAVAAGVFSPSARFSTSCTLRTLIRTAREVAQGMCHLHSYDIVHGNLTPDNVLLKSSACDKRGFVAKVADVAVMRSCRRVSTSSSVGVFSEPGCLAPEVFSSSSVGREADVYSFGLLLWEMMAGEPPFSSACPLQLMLDASQGRLHLTWPTDPHPPALVELGKRCLHQDYRCRPTFASIIEELAQVEHCVRHAANRRRSESSALSATAEKGEGGGGSPRAGAGPRPASTSCEGAAPVIRGRASA